jgi:hypothetical protein
LHAPRRASPHCRVRLRFDFGALNRARLLVRLFELGKDLALLLKDWPASQANDGTNCKLTCHVTNLSMLRMRMQRQ